MQEEVAAPFIRLLALLVRRNAATIGGERAGVWGSCRCRGRVLPQTRRLQPLTC